MRDNKTINKITKIRFRIIMIIIIISFLCILLFLAKLMFLDKDVYNKKLDQKIEKVFYGEEPPRGNIYDRKKRMLVGNVLIKSIVYTKDKNITDEEELELADKVSGFIKIDYSKLSEKDIKTYLAVKNKGILEQKLTKKEKLKKNNKEYSTIKYKELLISKITKDEIKKIDEETKEIIYIYTLMNKGYDYDEKIIKEEASEEEFAYFSENENNLKGFKAKTSYKRVYPYGSTFKTFLGKTGSIPKEMRKEYLKKGYELNDIVGISYLEKQYEKYLRGKKESYTIDSKGKKTIKTKSVKGNDLVLSIDIELQKEVEALLKEEIAHAKKEKNTRYFNKAFVLLSNPQTGEILANAGQQILFNGLNNSFIDVMPATVTNPVTPGSIVKGASHLVGYETGAMYFGMKVRDSCIKIANTPPKCSWKTLGTIDDLGALRLSSNYYQFLAAIKVGKGHYRYNAGLKLDPSGFNVYRNMYKQFGLGSKTGIDLPLEGSGYIGNDKKASHLLDFPIGQYDTYTPIQLLQYINTLATSGNRYSLHYMKEVISPDNEIIVEYDKKLLNKVKAKKINMDRVRLGLSQVTKRGGTGNNYVNYAYNASGKTGTSQSFIDTNNDGKIDKETISTLFGTYMPSEKPVLSAVIISPDVSIDTEINFKSQITKRLTNRVTNLYFEKYK